MGIKNFTLFYELLSCPSSLQTMACLHVMGLALLRMQAPENGRAVTEGSVLCLSNREPIGKVEEVFGPVMQPLYSLRYACGPTPPAELAVGAEMCSVERLTQYVLPEELYVKG